ncbi:hypothetical protein ElyMa_006939100 [Elysia marginata]|uniref:Uncharacterized protein n=1 Tax=Elysia marginata TaxID=1093978 RepID=A0AAV4JJX4_9GAST|nr:hypothetical protein ElyMa_006939100 [Elysia marginata]
MLKASVKNFNIDPTLWEAFAQTHQPDAEQSPREQGRMNSSVYRQRRPNEQHARPEPTATQLLRLQLRHGRAPTETEALGLGLAS